jgi:FdhE protein
VSTAPPAGSADPVVGRLREISREAPELGEAAQVYEIVLPLLRDADLGPPAPTLTAEAARAKLSRGVPLLHGLGLELDAGAVKELLLRLARALQTPGSAAERIRLALESDALDVTALLPHVAAGTRDPVDAVARSRGLDADLLWTLARNALKPALWSWCRQLAPLAAGTPWDRASCFVCGARATLAELRGTARARHLRCTQCGADWRVSRLRCPHCGTEDHAALRLLSPAGRRRTERVEACDRCRGYVKVIDAFDPTPPEMLAAEDLATLHLDAIARRGGYAG